MGEKYPTFNKTGYRLLTLTAQPIIAQVLPKATDGHVSAYPFLTNLSKKLLERIITHPRELYTYRHTAK